MNLIQDHVFDNSKALRQSFLSATPFKHVVIDNFFTEDALELLVEEFPAHGSTDGLVGDFGGKTKKAGRSDILESGQSYVLWDKLIQSDTYLNMLSDLSGIDDLLYDPHYNGAGIHENFEGRRGNIHIDYNYHPRTGYHRRLNAICYISPQWKKEYGGGLKLYEFGHRPQDGEKKIVDCLPNRCVLFETTENSWHGVQSITLPEDKKSLTRKSITSYYYTQDRPDNLTFPRHSTIYYPGEISETIAAGETLTQKDYKEIKSYQNRANSLIGNLYKEHERLYGTINKLQEARVQRRVNTVSSALKSVFLKFKFW